MVDILRALEIDGVNPGASTGAWIGTRGKVRVSVAPRDGEPIASVRQAGVDDHETVVAVAYAVSADWRVLPAPRRGEVVRQLGDALRRHKDALGWLVSLETGKILSEGLGEVQEMIDICDFAVGLSRQLYGRTMHSERAFHRMYEQWHPLGVVASSRRSIFRPRFGRGTPRLPRWAATCRSGSLPPRLP